MSSLGELSIHARNELTPGPSAAGSDPLANGTGHPTFEAIQLTGGVHRRPVDVEQIGRRWIAQMPRPWSSERTKTQERLEKRCSTSRSTRVHSRGCAGSISGHQECITTPVNGSSALLQRTRCSRLIATEVIVVALVRLELTPAWTGVLE